jgi:hypothetical protein
LSHHSFLTSILLIGTLGLTIDFPFRVNSGCQG